MSGSVGIQLADGVLELTLDRVEKRNALTQAMYATLADALEQANDDDNVGTILLRGAGEHFCAGNDIAEAIAIGRGRLKGEPESWRMIRALIDCAKPLVAAVGGHAIGIGFTMLLHCDALFVTPTARFQAPFARLGVVPEAVSSMLLPALVGHIRAFSILGMGTIVDAETSVQWGIANSVVSADHLYATARAAARVVADVPSAAMRQSKRLLRDRSAMHACAREEYAASMAMLSTPEAQQAFGSFFDRRS